jgi:endonuclease/exonuclease/phosphatase family metal-dependent hydrolase
MKAKRKLTLFDKIFLIINLALCLALIISFFAPFTDPRKFWVISFFGLAYPLLLLSNCILILYWGIRERWWFLLSVITILCGYSVLNNNIGLHAIKESIKPGERNIRLMTYNVHNFKKFGAKKDSPTKHEILDLIENAHPDIIGIQEFYSRYRGQYNMVDSMKKIMESNSYYLKSFDGNKDEVIGMAIFSRYPIIDSGYIHLSDELGSVNQCLYADVKIDTKIIRFYCVHLQSIQFDPQDYRSIGPIKTILPGIRSVRRIEGKLKIAFLKRAEQVFIIKAHAAKCPYPYIITGDFNDTPSSFAVNQMAKGLKNAFAEMGFGLGRTYNGSFPNYQIDYIMPQPQFDVLNYWVVRKKLSDHYPVVSDLVLR